jgi:hypothetical protein
MIFGSRQERFIDDNANTSQLTLLMQAEEVQASPVTGAQKITYTRNSITGDKPAS